MVHRRSYSVDRESVYDHPYVSLHRWDFLSNSQIQITVRMVCWVLRVRIYERDVFTFVQMCLGHVLTNIFLINSSDFDFVRITTHLTLCVTPYTLWWSVIFPYLITLSTVVPLWSFRNVTHFLLINVFQWMTHSNISFWYPYLLSGRQQSPTPTSSQTDTFRRTPVSDPLPSEGIGLTPPPMCLDVQNFEYLDMWCTFR